MTTASAARHRAVLAGPRTRRSTRRSPSACTSRAVFERADEFDIIHNGFDFLPLTYSDLVDHAGRHDDPRLLVARIVPVYERYDAHHDVRRDQRRRPPPAPALRRDDPSRHRHRRVRAPPASRRASAVLRPDPSRQGHRRRHRGRPPERSPARHRRDHPGRAILPRRGRAAHRRRASATSAPSTPPSAPRCSGGAHALLHLIDFDEPFGYSVVEAMACGTPVIAYSRGSMRELIAHGRHRLLVDDIDSAVAAVGPAGDLDRRRIAELRGRSLRRRDHDRPVRLAVYRDVLANRK